MQTQARKSLAVNQGPVYAYEERGMESFAGDGRPEPRDLTSDRASLGPCPTDKLCGKKEIA